MFCDVEYMYMYTKAVLLLYQHLPTLFLVSVFAEFLLPTQSLFFAVSGDHFVAPNKCTSLISSYLHCRPEDKYYYPSLHFMSGSEGMVKHGEVIA